MSKERWLIGLAVLGVILGMLMYAATLVTDKNRQIAVERLKVKGGAIAAKHRSAKTASKTPPAKSASKSEQATETRAEASGNDTATAFGRLLERKTAIQEDPKWKEALDLLDVNVPKDWSDIDRAKVGEFLKANEDLIRELIRLANEGGPLYELDYSKGFAMELPHLAQLRACARLLAGDAAYYAGDKDYGRAVEDILAGMKLANALDDEPLLISQLVRMAMDGIMYSAIETRIQGEDLPPEFANQLIAYASQAGARNAFADSYNTEGFFGLEAFDSVRTGDLSRAGFVSGDDWSVNSALLRLYGSAMARPLLNVDEQSFADIMSRMGDTARLPFYEAKPLLDQISNDIQDLPRTRFLSRTLLPALSRAAESQAQNEVRLDLMRLGLAVEQYHARTGGYPDNLDAIASTVGGSVPLDPFTGKPYVYGPSGTTFELYSAMGSAIDLSGAPNRRGADANGNYVWRGQH